MELSKNVVFCGWNSFTSISKMFSSFIYFVAHISTSFFLFTPANKILLGSLILLVHSSVGEHACCFQIMNNAAMNICVQIPVDPE